MFEPIRHDDHFDITPDPQVWVEANHPLSEFSEVGDAHVWQWEDGLLMASYPSFDKVVLRTSESELTVEVGFVIHYDFDNNGDYISAPARIMAQTVLLSGGQSVLTMWLGDGTVITETLALQSHLLTRTIMDDDGVSVSAPRLCRGPWEVSDTAVAHHGNRVAIRNGEKWEWMLSTTDWLAARSALRGHFPSCAFTDEGVPVVPR